MATNSERTTIPRLLGVHADPTAGMRLALGALPFVLLVIVYAVASHMRLAENPGDKLLPGLSQMVEAMQPLITERNVRTEKYIFWSDTLASLSRLAIGSVSALVVALLLGLNMGVFRGLRAVASPFTIFISMIPPLAVLPILFITLGIDEIGKITLIFIGTFPMMTRDIFLATQALPKEQLVKTLTLGGRDLAYVYRIALPQILPRAIDTFRLSLGAAWLFLIASEAIASVDGLGYRIFLVRRYLAMDIIIPYVAWITVLGFALDWLLKQLASKAFPWYSGEASR